jgi:hypothetical protein
MNRRVAAIVISVFSLWIGALAQADSPETPPLKYDTQQPLFEAYSDYRHTFRTQTITEHTLETELTSTEGCQTKTDGKTQVVPAINCMPLLLKRELQKSLGTCEAHEIVIGLTRSGSTKAGYWHHSESNYESVTLTSDCLCLQHHDQESVGGLRTWIWPGNAFKSQAFTSLYESRSCSLDELYAFFADEKAHAIAGNAYWAALKSITF